MVIGDGEWFVLIWFVNSAYIDKRNIRTDLLIDPQNLFGIFGISEPMTDFPFVYWGLFGSENHLRSFPAVGFALHHGFRSYDVFFEFVKGRFSDP